MPQVTRRYRERIAIKAINAWAIGKSLVNIGSPAAEPKHKIMASSNKESCRIPRYQIALEN